MHLVKFLVCLPAPKIWKEDRQTVFVWAVWVWNGVFQWAGAVFDKVNRVFFYTTIEEF